MLQALRAFKDKIAGIEKHFGQDVMARLRQLREEVAAKAEGASSKKAGQQEWVSVDMIASDIAEKVAGMVRQRENL